jgi:hypothetical protein
MLRILGKCVKNQSKFLLHQFHVDYGATVKGKNITQLEEKKEDSLCPKHVEEFSEQTGKA